MTTLRSADLKEIETTFRVYEPLRSSSDVTKNGSVGSYGIGKYGPVGSNDI